MDDSTTIPIRTLRNEIASVIKRVERGGSYDVTRHGHVVARLTPAVSETTPPGRLSDIWELRDESGIDHELLALVRQLRSDQRDPYERVEGHYRP